MIIRPTLLKSDSSNLAFGMECWGANQSGRSTGLWDRLGTALGLRQDRQISQKLLKLW